MTDAKPESPPPPAFSANPIPAPPLVTAKPLDSKGLLLGADIAKQIITLSIAIVTLTMTFAEKLGAKSGDAIHIPFLLKASWGLFAISLLSSIWTLLGITGTLNTLDKGKVETNPERSNIIIPARVMTITFGIGLALVFLTGYRLLSSNGSILSGLQSPAQPARVILAGVSQGVTMPVNLAAVDSAGKPIPISISLPNDKDHLSPLRLTLLCEEHKARARKIRP